MSKEHRDPEMDARLMDWAETRTIASTDDGASPSFEVLAEQRRRARHHTRVRQGVLLAAAAALLFVALPENTPTTAQSLPTPDPVALDVSSSPPVMAESVASIENPDPTLHLIHAEGEFSTVADEAHVDADGRILLALGEDRLGLGTESALVVESASPEDTRIRLTRGRLAAEVSSRGEDGRFTILAGEAEVEVIGTRFGVQHGDSSQPLRVWVREGIVAVRFDGASWELQADQELVLNDMGFGSVAPLDPEDTALATLLSANAEISESLDEAPPLPPPAPVIPPIVDELRSRLGNGEVGEVLVALENHLASYPTDVDAWELLATTARMQEDSELRLRALERIIVLDSGTSARRARYDAAELHLLNPDPEAGQRARTLLREFLSDPAGPSLLEPEARLALGRSEIEAGNLAAGRTELQIVLDRFVGTGPAVEAARLLGTLPPE